ncbi:MAG: DNA-directed DNA polymerase II small subunit [Candidatus Altiarchaeota archaeon]
MSTGGGDRKRGIAYQFTQNGLIIGAACIDKIISCNLDVDEIIGRSRENNIWLVTSEFIDEYVLDSKEEKLCVVSPEPETLSEAGPKAGESVVEVVRSRKPSASDIEAELVIHDKSDVTGKSTCEGKVEDFIDYFNTRYSNVKGVLQNRVEYRSVLSIDDLKSGNVDGRCRIICMVNNKRESDKGYRFLDVEDPTGELTVFISNENDQLARAFNRILPDEVVGVEGVLRNELFIASDITQPDIPFNRQPNYSEEDVYALFMSDIHVGSYLFLEREFESFIKWLHGHGDKRDVSEKVKYIFVAGDLVDGIGIYPHQEKELTIPDIYKQYDFLSLLLENIPDYIEVVLSMGNHDAVRLAEPQPRLPEDIGAPLYELPNVHVVGNPVKVTAHGVDVLMYHGTSLDTIISNVPECSYNRPEYAMIEYLRRRHLVPMYGGDSILPEERDYLFIKDVPDVFHCGHVHTNGFANYRGVNVINSGTWQGKTKYQEQLGHQPTPARVPAMNLRNHDVSMLYFGD